MELTGKIIAIMEAINVPRAKTAHCYMSQDYVLEVPGSYPRRCKFNIFGEDRIKQFNIQAGEELTIQFNIEAKEYNGKWFNDIRAYNVVRQQHSTLTKQNDDPLPFDAAGSPFPPFMEPEDKDAPF